MSESKKSKVETFIRREVQRAVQELAFDRPQHYEAIKDILSDLQTYVSWSICHDPYRMRELQDIMDWKRPPKD